MAHRAGSSERPAKPLLAAMLFALPLSAGGSDLSVTAVRFWSLSDVTRIAIETNGPFTFRTDRLSKPDRVFFDLRGAKPAMVDKGQHTIEVNDGRVLQVRVAETKPLVTRVVIDLSEGPEGPMDVVTSQLSVPDRLMVEVRPKNAESAPAPTLSSSGVRNLTQAAEPQQPSTPVSSGVRAALDRAERRPVHTKAKRSSFEPPALSARLAVAPPALPGVDVRQLVPEPPRAVERQPAPPVATDPALDKPLEKAKETPRQARRNSNGDRSLTRQLGLKIRRIVIDPGHGGHDRGTTGVSGLVEKELTLDVAKRVAALVEEAMGSEVILTRDNDRFVDLEDRAAFANAKKADLFLSIHANSSPIRTAAGAETYVLSFTTSKAAMEVAARENAASERSISELKELLQKIALKDKLDESRELAAKIQSALVQVTAAATPPSKSSRKDRGIKRAPFVVLIGAQMPAILTEIGFVTNAKEEAQLKKPEYRQKIAESILHGLQQYAETLGQLEVAQTGRRDGSE